MHSVPDLAPQASIVTLSIAKAETVLAKIHPPDSAVPFLNSVSLIVRVLSAAENHKKPPFPVCTFGVASTLLSLNTQFDIVTLESLPGNAMAPPLFTALLYWKMQLSKQNSCWFVFFSKNKAPPSSGVQESLKMQSTRVSFVGNRMTRPHPPPSVFFSPPSVIE